MKKVMMMFALVLWTLFSCTELLDEISDEIVVEEEVVEEEVLEETEEEIDSIINEEKPVVEWNGVFYTEQELAIWRQRAQAGPYKTNGDAGVNTPGDWTRIKKGADELLNGVNDPLWKGAVSGPTNEPATRHDRVRDAAFVYLITGEEKYAKKVVEFLMVQVTDPTVQWPGRQLVGDQGLFFTAGWMVKLLNAYSYVKNVATPNQQATIEKWFKEGADYFAKNVQHDLSKNFPDRLNENYSVKSNRALNADYREKWTWHDGKGAKHNQIPVIAYWYNNRRAVMVGYVGFAGAYFQNAEWTHHAKVFFKEMLKFSTFPDGTMGEYERNGDRGLPIVGKIYSSYNIEMFVLVADALARTGDFELYEYQTSEGMFGTEGGNKSLKLLIKTFYDQANELVDRYTLFEGKYYRLNLINPLDQNRHWVNDIWFVKANLYYKDDYFKKSYTRTFSTSKPYPASRWGTAGPVVYPWSGTSGIMPGYLFMYGGIEDKVDIFNKGTSN